MAIVTGTSMVPNAVALLGGYDGLTFHLNVALHVEVDCPDRLGR
jgi:hypothetical protein